MLQRLCRRVENLGFFVLCWCSPTLSFTRFAVVAIQSFVNAETFKKPYYCRNGIPRCFNKVRAWLSFAAVVTIVTFIPFRFPTFS